MVDVNEMIRPHEEAAALVAGKRVVSREVFYKMLPELRGRAFAVTGVESATVLQRIRDGIAGLPRGVDAAGKAVTWDTVKKDLVAELEPFLGDGADRRATLLIRTHGFQAFQSSNWRVAQEDDDTTHLQYLATEDDKVRDSHLALNGITLPKNDPFWATHTPPWEWGCRCRIRAMNPDAVEEERARDAERTPEERNVVEGPVLEQLRHGTLMRGGRRFDVTPPRESGREQGGKSTAFAWHPDDLRLPIGELELRYEPEVWAAFRDYSRRTMVGDGTTLWNWLNSQPARVGRGDRQRATQVTVRRLQETNPVGKEGTAEELGLSGIVKRPFSGRVKQTTTVEAGVARLEAGFNVVSRAGTEVKFGRVVSGHFAKEQTDARLRFLPAAELVAKKPAEVWENGLRRYYLGKVARSKGGAFGVVVVVARKGERLEEVLTYFVKSWREIEKLRSGKLIYAEGK